MRRFGGVLVVLLVALAGTLVGLSAPAYAVGATVTVSGNTVTVTGSAGADSPQVGTGNCGSTCVEVSEDAITSPDGSCTIEFDLLATCPLAGGAPTINVNLGAGDDSFEVQTIPETRQDAVITVDAGPGNDSLTGAGAIETWILGDGDDKLQPDEIGGPEDVGPDAISGGAGTDAVDYLFSAGNEVSGLAVSLDGVANDGTQSPGDVDNVGADVESVRGTNNNDTLVGNDLANTLDGANGDDTIQGLGGDDVIVGGIANDTIVGGAGRDNINGDITNLLLSGNDTIDTVDGEADYVACGPGADVLRADSLDTVSEQVQDNCETVNVSAAKPPVKIKGKRLDANKQRTKATVKVSCAGSATCQGKVTVKAGKKKVASGSYNIKAGKTKVVTVKLKNPARALLRKKGTVKVRLTLTSGGTSVTKKVSLTR